MSAALTSRRGAARTVVSRLLVILAAAGLVGTAWTVALGDVGGRAPGAAELLARASRFVRAFAGAGTANPAWTDVAALREVARLSLETLIVAVGATAIGLAVALLCLPLAARSLALPGSRPTGAAGVVPRLLLGATRSVQALLRGTPELIWALLAVFVVRPGLPAAVVALALHEAGVLGRLAREVVDDLPGAPAGALRSAGAGRITVAAYAALPRALPQLVTFALYRAEVVLRATVVVGFVTGVGLGYRLRLDLSFFRWTHVAVVLGAYVGLAWLSEAVAGRLRRRLP